MVERKGEFYLNAGRVVSAISLAATLASCSIPFSCSSDGKKGTCLDGVGVTEQDIKNSDGSQSYLITVFDSKGHSLSVKTSEPINDPYGVGISLTPTCSIDLSLTGQVGNKKIENFHENGC